MFKIGDKVRYNGSAIGASARAFAGVIGELVELKAHRIGASDNDEWRVKWNDDDNFIITMYAWSLELVPPDKFHTLAKEVADLVTTKQEAYGDSFGKSGEVMRQLYPNGISPDQMQDALVVVRILDKLFRIATKKDALGESPYRDICGYSLLGYARDSK